MLDNILDMIIQDLAKESMFESIWNGLSPKEKEKTSYKNNNS